jgi:hypothetical protein
MKNFKYLFILLFACLVLILGACAPTKYQKPVENFNSTTAGSKKIYFDQLKSSHESFTDRYEMKLKLDMITDDDYDYEGEFYIEDKEKILGMAKSTSIPIASLEIRDRAFKILEYYGKTLKTLASDEKTEALKTELTGLSEDTAKFLNTVEGLSDLSESFSFLESISDWAGPIGDAVTVINKVVEIISDYYREKALKEAIITTHPMVEDLVGLFRKEAVTAAEMRENNYFQMVRECRGTLTQIKKLDAASKYLIHNICNEIEVIQVKLIDPGELEKPFTLVIDSHREMKKMADGGPFDEMLEKVREFQQKLEVIKTKFELVMD